MRHAYLFIALVPLPDFGLAIGAEVQVSLPSNVTGQPPVQLVVDNLLMGSLAPHCRAGLIDTREAEVALVAEAPCGCFTVQAVEGDELVWIKLPGRQTDQQKLAFAEALRLGKLHGKVSVSQPPTAAELAARKQAAAEAEAKRKAEQEAAEKLKAEQEAAEKLKAEQAAAAGKNQPPTSADPLKR